MSGPAHDLSKLRINRDPPPEVRRAFSRTLLFVALAIALVAAAAFYLRSRRAVTVDTVVVERVDGNGGRVKIGGEVWSARALDEHSVIEPGARVQVAEIEGATALVYE